MVSKTAFSFYNGRVAPVFDVARSITIIVSEDSLVLNSCKEDIGFVHLHERAEWLKEKDVQTLVCGAISRPLKEIIEHMGIKVFGFISGESVEVVDAWFKRENLYERFSMPGCMCRNGQRLDHDCKSPLRRRKRGCRTEWEE